MSDYINYKEYKLPNGRTVTADFNELGLATITIQAMDALFDIINSSDVVEVVRCKDCVYRPCLIMPHSSDFDYCSYGERAKV